MNKLILIALLISLTFAQYTLNLQKQVVTRPETTTPLAKVAYEELLRYFEVSFNTDSGKVKTVFDTASAQSWKLVPTSSGTVKFSSVQGGLESTSASEVLEKVSVKDHRFKDVKFNEGAKTPASAKELTDVVTAGFGLGIGDKDFQLNVQKSEKLISQGFSFYYSEKINQIRFGSPQGYFAKEPPVSFKVQEPATNQVTNKWKLYFTNIGIDGIANANNGVAELDSTTEYIWLNTAQYNFVKTTLTNYYQVQFGTNDECPCSPEKKPEIYLQFSNGANTLANKNTDAKFKLSYEDYIYKNTNGVCSLAIRERLTAGNVILGNSFLKGVYTWFKKVDDGTSSVKMATAFKVPVQKLKLDNNWRVGFMVTGSLIILFAVLCLLAMLRKVPYDPSLYVAPVQYVNVNPQLAQSQVQMVQYSQPRVMLQPQQQFFQPQSVVQQSVVQRK